MAEYTSTPKVSIYISTCNRIDKLKRAINSVLLQDYECWELLICDDASIDGTKEYCQALCERNKKIKYFRNESNRGACATRNLGIFNASGMFITGLDDDDEFTHERLSKFVKHWNEKYSFICCDFINQYNNKRNKYYNDSTGNKVFTYQHMLFENEASNQIFTLTTRLQAIGGFKEGIMRLQDWDTWLRLSFEYGPFLRLSSPTYIMYHDHSINEARVSQNKKITESLLDLAARNPEIYTKNDSQFMSYIVQLMNKNARFVDSLYWSFKKVNPKFIMKYFLQ